MASIHAQTKSTHTTSFTYFIEAVSGLLPDSQEHGQNQRTPHFLANLTTLEFGHDMPLGTVASTTGSNYLMIEVNWMPLGHGFFAEKSGASWRTVHQTPGQSTF